MQRLKALFRKQRPPNEAATAKKCHLLLLPAELRNRVWDLAFTDTVVELGASTTTPPLLLTCKQINSEAQGAYWTLSEFKSRDIRMIPDFLARVGPTRLGLISTVTYGRGTTAMSGSALRKLTGIAYSAFMAQWNLFWAENWLRNTGIILPAGLKMKAPFVSADGEVVTSSTPWQEFGKLLGKREGSGLGVKEGSTSDRDRGNQVGQLKQCSREMGKLVKTVADQSHFFEYEHLDREKCWGAEWCVVPGYRCGCPVKEGE